VLSTDAKRDIARRFVTDLFGKGDLAMVDEVVDPDLVDHNTFPGLPPGIEGFRLAPLVVREGFPDLHSIPARVVVDGDRVFYNWEGTATHTGPFAGFEPTGGKIRMAGMEIITFKGDRVAEHWTLNNALEVMQQLGLVPGGTPSSEPREYTQVPACEGGVTTSMEENKAIMLRQIEEIWNGKNLDAADELYHPQAVTPYVDLPPGPAGCKAVASVFHTAMPDFHMTVEDILAEDDLVVARVNQTGTHGGELWGMPATGTRLEFAGLAVVKICDGRILSSWFQSDSMEVMGRLGVFGR